VVGLMLVEYVPRPIPSVLPAVPSYVSALQARSDGAGVLDLVSGYYSDRPFGSDTGAGIALYYQTIHQHPMASGYIARVPASAWQQLVEIKRLVEADAFETLCRDYRLRYVVIAPATVSPGLQSAQLVDRSPAAELFDLAPRGECLRTSLDRTREITGAEAGYVTCGDAAALASSSSTSKPPCVICLVSVCSAPIRIPIRWPRGGGA
jgi:hypothetical protein